MKRVAWPPSAEGGDEYEQVQQQQQPQQPQQQAPAFQQYQQPAQQQPQPRERIIPIQRVSITGKAEKPLPREKGAFFLPRVLAIGRRCNATAFTRARTLRNYRQVDPHFAPRRTLVKCIPLRGARTSHRWMFFEAHSSETNRPHRLTP